MTGFTDKIKGAVNETVGTVKQKIGEATDRPELEGEGIAQQMKGKGQGMLGEAKEKVADVVEATKDMARVAAKDAKDAIHRATK